MEWVSVVVVLIVVAVVVVGLWWGLRERSSRRDLIRAIQKVSHDSLADILIPDGLGGEIYIDHLLLTPRGLVVLDVKDVQGSVFAGERLDLWSATSSQGRVEFDNPLPTLQDRTAALNQLLPGVPIETRVVFQQSVSFPKGHPDNVRTLENFVAEYESVSAHEDGGDYGGHWETLKSAATYSQ